MSFLYRWCEERFEFQVIADDILAKFVPVHMNIFYCFGGILLTSFLFQVVSGFALTIYYQPTIVEAYFSMQDFILEEFILQEVLRNLEKLLGFQA